MLEKLGQRDRRVLRLGLIGVAVVVVFAFGFGWFEHWAAIRASLQQSRGQLKAISVSGAERQKLLAVVPVFEIPKPEEEQKFLFRKELIRQLKEAGIKVKPLKFVAASRSTRPGYKLLCIQCSGQAELEKILDLLVNLKKNPYLVAVEELEMKRSDPKKEKSRNFELNMKVSTFVKR